MSIFLLRVSAGVLFAGAFSLWVSLMMFNWVLYEPLSRSIFKLSKARKSSLFLPKVRDDPMKLFLKESVRILKGLSRDLVYKENCGSSHRRRSVTKVLLKNFAKFTRKHLCRSLFFNKVTGWDTGTAVFLFCEISRKTYFVEHLQTAACTLRYTSFHYRAVDWLRELIVVIMSNLALVSSLYKDNLALAGLLNKTRLKVAFVQWKMDQKYDYDSKVQIQIQSI